MDENDVNPDEILKLIQDKDKQQSEGKLKIFFGMSAGVGKTYAMLEEAQRKVKEGIDIVIGSINTHGRKDTEALIKGIKMIPEKWIEYKGTVFEELDIDEILKIKPQIVIIDELAHTNLPGSRHPKRWQDVLEILEAGIDVYTTLNVQHVESRKDIVEALTEVQIRETVPDVLLEKATSIEFIDLSPEDLLKRLKEGKVYLGEQSLTAAQNFFREENLTALREIALRFTAEKVDHDLHGMLIGKGWKTRERLMVAISPSPSSEPLIRAARRFAFELDAPWVAVYVDNGKELSNEEQARLNKHFNLARELGAEVSTTYDIDVPTALRRIAKQKDITCLVVGRAPLKKSWSFNFFKQGLIERLENENKDIDIVILRKDSMTPSIPSSFLPNIKSFSLFGYLISFLFVILLAGIGLLVTPAIGYKAVGFLFLLGILLLSLFLSQGPVFLAALLSALVWAAFFIPPYFTYFLTDFEDIALVSIYFFAAAIIGVLTSRLHQQDQFLQKREERIGYLYEINKEISSSTDFKSLRLNFISRLESIFPGKFDLIIKNSEGQLVFNNTLPILKNEKERSAAQWVFKQGKIGGWSTDTLPSVECMYFPINLGESTIGILVYQPKTSRNLSLDEISLIQTALQQLSNSWNLRS